MTAQPVEYEPGVLYLGSGLEMTPTEAAKEHIGAVQAWDVRTLEKKWQVNFKSPMWGPMMSTAGGLVFAGGTTDAEFRAFDAKTGEILWNQRLDGGIVAPPISFEFDGKQYISVVTGWGVDAGRFLGLPRPGLGDQDRGPARRHRLRLRRRISTPCAAPLGGRASFTDRRGRRLGISYFRGESSVRCRFSRHGARGPRSGRRLGAEGLRRP